MSKITKFLIACSAFVLLSGCAAVSQDNNPNQLNSQWVDSAATFEQKTITGVLVAAVTDNATNRRVFEDIACNVLAFHGIPATPSYKTIPQAVNLTNIGGGLNFAALNSAAKLARASDILAIVKGQTQTNVTYNPGMTWGPGPGPWGPGPWGDPFWGPDPFWGGWAIPPSITQQNITQSNAELISVKSGNVLWTATFSTADGQASLQDTYQGYAELIVQALLHNGFLIPVSMPAYQVHPATELNLPAAK